MKRIILFIMPLIALLGMNACKSNNDPAGPTGKA